MGTTARIAKTGAATPALVVNCVNSADLRNSRNSLRTISEKTPKIVFVVSKIQIQCRSPLLVRLCSCLRMDFQVVIPGFRLALKNKNATEPKTKIQTVIAGRSTA